MAVALAGLALGIAAEWYSYAGSPAETLGDFAVGVVLVGCGCVAWRSRSASSVGQITAGAGFAWFAGNFASWGLYLHRGPLAQVILTYPSGRAGSRRSRCAVAAAYLYAAAYPIAENSWATIAFASLLLAFALGRYLDSRGALHRATAAALGAALAFSLILVIAAVTELTGRGNGNGLLWAYEATVAVIGAGLTADLVRGRWSEAALVGLVVDLGDPHETGTLRDKLAQALGDPSLRLGYWLPESGRYVDDAGRPMVASDPGGDRAVTPIGAEGEPIAVLVHASATLGDPELLRSVAAAARIALANAQLQAELQSRVADVVASRRRIVETADRERERLAERLREGPERRLEHVARLLAGVDRPLDRQLEAARTELGEFARGVRPRALTEHGLLAALADLARRSPVPTRVAAPSNRLPGELEAAVYFICAEALANVAKHARAATAEISVEFDRSTLRASVIDDGAGGANPSGSGLRGLADRVEALGGRLAVESPPGNGTRVEATIPLSPTPAATDGPRR